MFKLEVTLRFHFPQCKISKTARLQNKFQLMFYILKGFEKTQNKSES